MKRLFYTSEKTDNRIFQYVLGFQPSDGRLLLDDETQQGWVFLDGRYIEKVIDSGAWRMEKVLHNKKILEHMSEYIPEDEIVTIEKSLPYSIYEKLMQPDQEHDFLFTVEDASWQSTQRIIKTPDQRAKIQQAIVLTQSIREYVQRMIDSSEILGMTELQLRGKLIQLAYTLGAQDEAFDTIVATGAHTAIPHHTSSNEPIGVGPLLIDMGRKVDGWCSDFTRSVWITTPKGSRDVLHTSHSLGKDEFDKVVAIVREAHDVAIAMVEPGVAFADIAKAARKVIEDAGYGEYYPHSLGHGVGLDIHEAPRVSMKSQESVEKGMVFTIEPGIYLPGKFGVRWENIVIVQ